MAEKSYIINLLNEYATFKDFGWKTFVYDNILALEEVSKKLNKERIVADKLKVEVQHLKEYVKVLENQLSLSREILRSTRKVKYPIYTKRRRKRKDG